MKKFFTLAAAVLASFSLWAVEPTFESANWAAGDFATVVAAHDGLTILSDKTAFSGNFAGTQYIALGGGCDMTSPSNYIGITAEGIIDSVAVFWAPNGTNNTSIAWATWGDATNFNNVEVEYMDKTETYKASKSLDAAIWQTIDLTGKDAKAIVLTRQLKKAKINGTQQSNFGDNQTVNVLGIKVWLQETKTVVSTEETITAVTVNGDSLSAAEIALINDRNEDYWVFHNQAYATAPTVVFSKHTVITYDDTTTKVKDEDIEVVAEYFNVEFSGEFWRAALVGTDKTFKVDMSVAASAVITYMDGETVLGTETIAQGGTAAEYAQYESKELATFGGWYNDAALTDPVDLSVQTFNADATIYGKFTKAYASSLNIEQIVLDYGKGYDIKSALTAGGFAYKNINDLDSLNDEKTARNEPYLGLKIKAQGGYIACNIHAGDLIRVKFGYVAADVKAYANDQEMTLTPAGNALDVLEYTATAETFVKIQTTTEKTVVIKQIMVNEAIADVTLPDQPTGINNTSVETKAVKVIKNGQLFIEKNGVLYNAQGSVVK